MENEYSYDGGLKFKPNYKWPEVGTEKNCPKCDDQLELIENRNTYFGKPWWCVTCQWQFSEDDLAKVEKDSLEEE